MKPLLKRVMCVMLTLLLAFTTVCVTTEDVSAARILYRIL